MNNYYDLLGVSPDCSQQDIKDAYRKMSMKFHPDRNSDDSFFEKHYRKVKDAYEILSDVDKRKNYDGKQKSNIPKTYSQKLFLLTLPLHSSQFRPFHQLLTKLIGQCGFVPGINHAYFIATNSQTTFKDVSTSIKHIVPKNGFILAEIDPSTLYGAGLNNRTIQWLQELNLRNAKSPVK